MTSRTTAGAFASLLSLALLTGCGEGKKGAAGDPGAPGPTGPLGPAAEPPRIDSVSPRFISAGSNVRIRGAHFSPNAADNVVYANGTVGTVISATDTEIWVTGLDAGDAQSADITVRALGSISNPWTVGAGKSGDTDFVEPIAPNSPRSVALDATEAWLYVGDDNDGVYRIALEGGKIEKVESLAGRTANVVKRGPDGKIYVASQDVDGSDRIDRLEDDGTLTLISQNVVSNVNQMTWDDAGNFYVADDNGEVYRRDADGQAFNYYGISAGNSLAGLEWADGQLVVVYSYGTLEGYDASGASAVYQSYLGDVQNPIASTTDGVNMLVLGDDDNGAIFRVGNGESIAVVSGHENVTNQLDAGSSSLVLTAEGEFFFADPFDSQQIVASSKEGTLRAWYQSPDFYYDVAETGGDYYIGFADGCYDAMFGGSTMLRVSGDGAVSRFAENVCAVDLTTYGGNIVVLDARGDVSAITTTGAVTPVSNDPNLFGTYEFAVDADGNLYVGTYTAAYQGAIIKISADGSAVDTEFVTGLYDEPQSLAVVGDELYFSTYSELQKVPTATGGTPTVLFEDFGFNEFYGVSAGRDGALVFTAYYFNYNQFGTFAMREDGNLELATQYLAFDLAVDSFNNYYSIDGDIVVELP